jgi:hypothetical protein
MITEGLKGRDFIRVRAFTKAHLETMLEVGIGLKADRAMHRGPDEILR